MKPHCVFLLFWFDVICGDQTWHNLFERPHKTLSVDGAWSSWQTWSLCYNNTKDRLFFYPPWENFMVQRRNRTCTEPEPLAGGQDCGPSSVRFRQCSCVNPLGLGNGLIKDEKISASDYLDNYPPSQARLSKGYVGWCANSKANYLHKPYIQIDFESFATVTRISTIGNQKGRIKEFKLEYSLNGRIWNTIFSDKEQTEDRFYGNLLPGNVKINSFDSHKVLRHLRLVTLDTFQLPCLSMELYGCVFSCGQSFTKSFGQVVGRSSVEIDQNCLWRIEVRNTTSLSFDFNVFYVMCYEGYLDFYDGSTSFTEAALLSRKCLQDDMEEIPVLKLLTNQVWLHFVSNSSSSETGFNIRYFSECNQNIKLVEGEEYVITSPNYPEKYLDNLDCFWNVSSPVGIKGIKVITNDFHVESSSNSTSQCLGDVVIFQKETSRGMQIVNSFCNNNKPESGFSISSKTVLIFFKSDLIASEKGFKFTLVSGVKKNQPTERTSTVNEIQKTSSLLFTHGINDTEYISKEQIKKNDNDDTWTIIIICVFSSFAIVLLLWILTVNIRRFISNRNDIKAHCVKVREDEVNKQQQSKTTLLHQVNQVSAIIGKPSSPKTCLEYEENLSLLPKDLSARPSAKNLETVCFQDTGDMKQCKENSLADDQTDLDGNRCSFDSSSPQIHSPLKLTIENMELIDNIDDLNESVV